jgi:GT2 family glycosyltransferase/glycosyltransferase involved in cell wall biosynthesis
VRDERIIELSRRLADKQREIEALQQQVRGVMTTRRWKLLSAVSLARRLLMLQPEAYHRLLAHLRKQRNRFVTKGRGVTNGGSPSDSDNARLYELWRAANEPDASQLAAQERIARAWPFKPLISVVVPVFRPPADALADTIASLTAQTYARWELVLVLAGPQPDAVVATARAATRDDRVRLITLAENRGIAANTNAGIAAATGDYVAFLDHDDLLSPDMMFEVVRVLRAEPGLDFVTFDEDKIAGDGKTRLDPIFKPSISSPEHLLSFNDRMHSVIRKQCLEQMGGLASGVDGAQDWDLGLRCLEHGATGRHIPRVLYHWRMVPGSAAGDAMAKPWAYDAQLIALRGHLERERRANVSVDHPHVGVIRVCWARSTARVSIIIPTKDKAKLLDVCLRSIRERSNHQNYEIIVIDTGSVEQATRDLYQKVADDPIIKILYDREPFNFSRVNNLGARQATGSILLFLNNDIEAIDGDWLDELARWAERPEIGCVGPKLMYPDGTLQHAGIVTGMGGHGSHVYQGDAATHKWGVFGSVDHYRNYLMLGGACLAIRRTLFDELGGFDEKYILCYSDLDLCLRAAEAGFRNVYTPYAQLYHHEGGTRGLHFPLQDVLRASVQMYPLVIQGDPFYNRNLSYAHRTPTIASGDAPQERAELIRHIAGLFKITPEVREALHRELLNQTSEWRRYQRLVRSTMPSLRSDAKAQGSWRLLLVSHDLSRSGAPMVLLHLTRALVRLGHAVTVLSPTEGRLREDLEEAGADVIVSPLALEAPYALDSLFEHFDAILPNTVLAWRVVLAARTIGKPVIWLIQESYYGLTAVRAEAGAIQALALADEVVFPSRQTLTLYREFDSGNMSSELYGIDPPSVPHQRPSLGEGRVHIVTVGSIEPRKGQDVLVTAFRKLPRAVRDRCELHLLGRFLDATFVDTLRGVIRSLPVHLHGEVSPGEALAFLDQSDVLVCPSRDETGPLAVMEAMALAKPVISTEVGAVPELIEHGANGLLIQPGEVPPLRTALERMVADADFRRRLGQAARVTYEKQLSNERYGHAFAARIAHAIEQSSRGTSPSASLQGRRH